MTTYKEIFGKPVKTLATDPDNTEAEGQIWYNSTSGSFKSVTQLEAWSAASPVITARTQSGGTGLQTAGLIFGGFSTAYTNVTEEYNGSGWSNGGNLNTSRNLPGAGGTQTAGLAATGFDGTSNLSSSEEYDGSTWSNGNPVNTARRDVGGCGTQTAGLVFGGYVAAASNATEEYDGTSWVSGNNMNTARYAPGDFGTQTAAVSATGNPGTGVVSSAEEYDGTSWTSVNPVNTARESSQGAGILTSGLIFGGDGGGGSPLSAATETYDGTSFTTSPVSLATARTRLSGGGTSSAAFAATGFTTVNTAVTEEYNKSASVITAAAWASGGNLNTGRGYIAGFGIQTSAVAAGGYNGTARVNNVEEYNGSTWSNATGLPAVYAYGGGAGIESAGLFFGGTYPSPPFFSDVTFEYDGSTWTSGGSLSIARYNMGCAGIQTAALSAGGVDSTSSLVNSTEEYDGTSWAGGGNMNTTGSGMGGAGTQTSSIMFGRSAIPSADNKNIEEYNGTSWTTNPAKMQVCEEYSSSSQNSPSSSAIIFGDAPAVVNTEQWNGTVSVTSASLATARRATGGAGTASSGLAFGGSPSAPTVIANTEEFTGETSALNLKTLTTS